MIIFFKIAFFVVYKTWFKVRFIITLQVIAVIFDKNKAIVNMF